MSDLLIHFPDTCIESRVYKDALGYGRFSIDSRRNISAHRAAYRIFVGIIPCGYVIMHTCDNPSCVNPKHLVAGDQKDNIHDCIRKGRRAIIKANAKITQAIAEEIRAEDDSMASSALAVKYGLCSSRIRQIRRGEGWTSNKQGGAK